MNPYLIASYWNSRTIKTGRIAEREFRLRSSESEVSTVQRETVFYRTRKGADRFVSVLHEQRKSGPEEIPVRSDYGTESHSSRLSLQAQTAKESAQRERDLTPTSESELYGWGM